MEQNSIPMQQTILDRMSALLSQKNYPCVAALKSFHSKDFEVGTYQKFGSAEDSFKLATDLTNYAEQYEKTKSPFFTFWATYPNESSMSEEEFENKMWKELSALASHPEFSQTWDPHFSSNPADKNFCFSLGGRAYFVVGLHQNSQRLSRQFEHPVLIFNLYEQFRQLERSGQFDAMVQLNRKRDEKFQGSANPVVVEHGNDWESIQFSGRQNGPEWKCPFAKLFDFAKASFR